MLLRGLADLILILHLGFVLFVLLGGLLAFRWSMMPWFHLPAVLWAISLEFGGWICPLTPLENWLRQASGEAGYSGGFIEHYVLPVIYPIGLTPSIQIFLGCVVIVINIGIYGMLYVRRGNSW
ncbi:MAG: DUF2784 domain-containing protein [Nitrospirales bacterium]